MPKTVPKTAGERKKKMVDTLTACDARPTRRAMCHTRNVLMRWPRKTIIWLSAGKRLLSKLNTCPKMQSNGRQ